MQKLTSSWCVLLRNALAKGLYDHMALTWGRFTSNVCEKASHLPAEIIFHGF